MKKVISNYVLSLSYGLLLSVVFATSCASQSDPGSRVDAALESQREALSNLPPGIDEQQVRLKLGPPDEVRFAKGDLIEGEAYRWAYGAKTAGGFANIGIVIFSTNGTVLDADCPTRPKLFSQGALGIPLRASPKRTEAGVSCVIDSIRENDLYSEAPSELRFSLGTVIHYSLVNEGSAPFLFRQPTPHIKFNLVLEVFDSDMHLKLRQDYNHFASPYHPNEKDWPVIKVLPGNRVSEAFPIWLTEVFYGKPAAGKYFIRLLFPFEPNQFYSSNLKEFSVP